MNLRTMAFAAVALAAFGTSAVSVAQTAPGSPGTPPPPPVPSVGPSPLPAASPSAVPSDAAPTPTPTPDLAPTTTPDAAASPSAAPAAGKRGRHRSDEGNPSPAPSPTDTPEPPQFSTLDGVWEVAFQPLTGARTSYSHLYVTQNGNDLTGTWRRDGKTTVSFTGTFDGRLLKLTATDGASTFTFSGYEENYMDMVGLFTDGDPKHAGVPFTAAHRKRERDKTIVR